MTTAPVTLLFTDLVDSVELPQHAGDELKHRQRYRFALTGSSARKLKRGDVNLLAGRVVNRKFFPLTAAEMGDDFVVNDVLRFGSLPFVVSERSGDVARIDLLEAYAENYLTQEIRHEALVKRLDSFTRFLPPQILLLRSRRRARVRRPPA